ncbi:glycosyltransferase 87 family protein [Isoptericola sp. 178]|uniref:glycosyltransferase 87 family protein n=1 Tax=Isoptericola sp. 178 TaxID=3064651 RepID=UPI002713E31C|nr:glycosyltransferase 87 family protein [Isoptericola sp. 178]MDO8145619.1 glycosyltransferase 87 family protein [Isoptericola sp. 178]
MPDAAQDRSPENPPTATSAPAAGSGGRLLASPWLLALAFVVVHARLVHEAISWQNTIFGDVTLYEWWARQGLSGGEWPVLDYTWVYPAGALVPVGLPGVLSVDVLGYEIVWTAMIVLLDAVATVVLVRMTPRGVLGAWWWLLFLLALGPIFLGRIDGVVAPMILVALVLARRHPRIAVAVATAGAWVKISPGAVVVAIAATRRSLRDLLRTVVVPGAVVSAVVVGLALAGGAGVRALSVFGQQGSRTLQAESVAATWFSVARWWDPSVRIEYNDEIYTFEVLGDAARTVADTLDWLLILAVVAVAALTWWVARRHPARTYEIVLLSAAAQLVALIVFNKVGSPQFIAWIGPVVAVALASLPEGRALRAWWPPALGMVLVAYATYLVYPVGYGPFLAGDAWIVVIEALRNAALVVLMVGAVWQLVRLGTAEPGGRHVTTTDDDARSA